MIVAPGALTSDRRPSLHRTPCQSICWIRPCDGLLARHHSGRFTATFSAQLRTDHSLAQCDAYDVQQLEFTLS